MKKTIRHLSLVIPVLFAAIMLLGGSKAFAVDYLSNTGDIETSVKNEYTVIDGVHEADVDLKKSMFMLADSTDKKSRRFKKAFDEWIEDISVGDRKKLINDIFYALERRKLQSFTQKKGVLLTVLYLILDFPKYHRSTRDAVFLLANRYLTGEA